MEDIIKINENSSLDGRVAEKIFNNIQNSGKKEVVLINIGTDLVIGDCLGPIIGNNLLGKVNNINIYGTLDSLINARNINENLEKILELHKDAYFIALDSCIGNHENIGSIVLCDGPLQVGAAFRSDLPTFGDCSIKGIVSSSPNFSSFVTNTRLSLILKMANALEFELLELDKLLKDK